MMGHMQRQKRAKRIKEKSSHSTVNTKSQHTHEGRTITAMILTSIKCLNNRSQKKEESLTVYS